MDEGLATGVARVRMAISRAAVTEGDKEKDVREIRPSEFSGPHESKCKQIRVTRRDPRPKHRCPEKQDCCH